MRQMSFSPAGSQLSELVFALELGKGAAGQGRGSGSMGAEPQERGCTSPLPCGSLLRSHQSVQTSLLVLLQGAEGPADPHLGKHPGG